MRLSAEVMVAGGYALALVVVGLGLDALARVTHRRAQAYRTAGFRYHETHDHWVCPEGEHLWPHEYDGERRLVRYRAKASVCNGCPVKGRCTDSDEGREIVRPLDPWPHSEAGRFHRGLALVPVTLAMLIAVVEGVRHPQPPDLLLLTALTCVVGLAARRLIADFRGTPANFPSTTPSHGLRIGSPRPPSSTRWGWDR